VSNVVVQFVATNRVKVSWTPGFDAATTVSKYDIYFNLAGWSSWVEDRGTTSVEVTVPSAGVLPQVRVAPRGWYGPGPATWFCDPPARTCING
jgi:hypothetical protein